MQYFKKTLLLIISGYLAFSLVFPQTGILASDFLGSKSIQESYPSVLNRNLSDFELIDQKQGWMLLDNQLFWTEDGGLNWKNISPQDLGANTISAVDFSNNLTGRLVALLPVGGETSQLTIFRTIDGGLSWQSQELNLFEPGEWRGLAGAVFLDFIDENQGWMVIKAVTSSNFSEGSLFRTKDGGQSWERLQIPIGESVVFLDSQYGFTSGGAAGDNFFRTTDGGATWKSQADLFPVDPGKVVAFQLPITNKSGEALLITVVDTDNANRMDFYTSKDKGESWTQSSSLPLEKEFSAGVQIPSASSGTGKWLVLPPGQGELWQLDTARNDTRLIRDDPQFVNISHLSMGSPTFAWAGYQFASCKDGNCTTDTALLKSLDSGRSWEALPLPPPSSTAVTPADNFANNLPGSSLENIQVDLPRTLTTEGQGIDKCEIPTLSQLQAWASYGPYQATNLYFGGVNRACANSAISESYLVDLSTQGWTFIPTWVGPQSRCWNIYSDASRNISTNLTTAHQQGVDEANLAIAKASAIGLTEADKSSTVIYYDLEGFDLPNSGCVNSAKAFISGWTETLNANGNIAGLYGRGGVLNELFAANTPPDVIWPANWLLPAQYRANATVWNVSGLPDSLWSNHQRIRQYAGPHTETWGSVTIQVDSNVIDGVVADISGTFPLKITKSGDGNGTVNSTPGGIGCGNDCIGTYTRFSTVTLTATADSDSVFNSWSGNCTPTGATTCQVTLEAATTVTATFSLIYPKLTIVKNGEGGGTVTSAPVGINCGATCAENFNLQQVVELTAHPDDVSHLKTWSANCAVTGTNTCQVTMDTTKSVTTTFEWNSYPVNVNKSGNGSGTVTSNPSGINCGTDCQEAYKYNNLVTLTATPASGSAFTGWTGPCTVNGDYTCQVTVDKVNDVTATFMLGYLLTVTRNGNGSGTVISSPAGITCGTDCSSDFARNTTVTITATPTPGSFFSGWGGACAGTTTLTCQVSMDSARQVTISFNTIYLFMPWTRKN